MKKLLSLLSLIALCISLAACSTESPQNSGSTTIPTNTTPSTAEPTDPQPKKTALTILNADDYLIFTSKAEDIKITDEPLGNERGTGSVTLSVNPKKRGDFDGVSVSLILKCASDSWGNKKMTIDIPFDGRTEVNTKIYSYITDYVDSSPSFTVEIESITGYFVE